MYETRSKRRKNICVKKGHTSRVCSKKSVKCTEEVEGSESSDAEEDNEGLDQLSIKRLEEVIVNKISDVCVMQCEIEGKKIQFEVDTGAGVTLISEADYNKY